MEETLIIEEYQVKTSVFEGPLEVLLRMIEDRKLFINEISLAEVTDDYLAYVKNLPQFDFGQVTGFMVVAATLILIKSKSLLPNFLLTEEEKTEVDDLEKRLALYQVIKEIGQDIKEKFGKNIIFTREEDYRFGPIFSPDEKVNLSSVHNSILEVFNNLPKKEFLPEVTARKVISLEEVMENLTERIQNSLRFSFKDFSSGGNHANHKEKKVHVIVSFLAMLELVKQGIVNAVQNNNFDDIGLEKYTEENLLIVEEF